MRFPNGIGVTGGIASGKSTVCGMLRDLGYTVFDADQLGREVMRKGTKTHEQIVEVFGKDILLFNGEINRKALGEIVFNDYVKLDVLEKIVIPDIYELLELKIRQLPANQIWFFEAALLYKTRAYKDFRQVWQVWCPEQEQINRVFDRDKIDLEMARRIIARQGTTGPTECGRLIRTDRSIAEIQTHIKELIEKADTPLCRI